MPPVRIVPIRPMREGTIAAMTPSAEILLQRAVPQRADDLGLAAMKSGLVACAIVESGRIGAVSPAFAELLGRTSPYHRAEERSLLSIVAEPDRVAVETMCELALRNGERSFAVCSLLGADENPVPVALSCAPSDGIGSQRLLVIAADLACWFGEPAAPQPHYLDPLTGIPTRTLLIDRMKIALAAARRYRRRSALLHIVLDRLDVLGRELGRGARDDALRTVAETLRGCVRDSDTVARLGGSEFALLLSEIGRREDAGITAARVVREINSLFGAYDPAFKVSARVGVAVYPTDAANLERLMQCAEAATRSAADEGGGRFALAEATAAELSAIAPLEFADRHKVGIEVIDAEHKALVAGVNDLVRDLGAGAEPATLEIEMRALVRLLRGHLATDARFRTSSPYGAAIEHKTRNLRFLDELDCILFHVDSQSIALACRHIVDWLVLHLSSHDPERGAG